MLAPRRGSVNSPPSQMGSIGKMTSPRLLRLAPALLSLLHTLELDRRINCFSQLRRRGITHRCWPDIKPPSPTRWNFPDTPDTLPLVITLVGHIVPANVLLGPVASSIVDLILAADEKCTDPVSSFARHDSLPKSQVQFHHMPAGPVGHQEKALPGAGGKSSIGLDRRWGRIVPSMGGHRGSPQTSGHRLRMQHIETDVDSFCLSLLGITLRCQASVIPQEQTV